ncbi:hypothetical protein ANCCAN_08663 [Ancylostoma caninum]|uniref:Uncharacterized protein n=1 Tax=Ancylostoma caninum TaxID=29170 RepID=A0A368GLV5_ANCCA|nr:hypothetical protein ANCCAN_08663 [Ancylostoma caninum]
MFMTKFMLTRTPTPSTPLLSQVPRNSSSPSKCRRWRSVAGVPRLTDFWEDAVVDNIDEEYDRLVQHLRDSAKSAESLRVTKRRLLTRPSS